MSLKLSATVRSEQLFRLVRDQAFKAMALFTKKLEDHAATMVGEISQLLQTAPE